MPTRLAYVARLSKMYNGTLFIGFTSQIMWRSCVKTAGAHPYKSRFLEKKVERKSISSTGERHGSRITIHSDILTSMKPLSGDTCAKNSRNMILAGYNRTMAEWAAHISNYPRGQGKEWRPGGRRDPGYQDIPLSHLCELISAMNDPDSASHISRAGCDSFQHIPC